MVVSDERIVDHIREVLVGVARDVTLVGVAEHRIEKNAYTAGFNQNAGMTKVAPACSIAIVFRIWLWLLSSEERAEQLFVFAAELESFAESRQCGGLVLHSRQGVHFFTGERHLQMDCIAAIEPGRAEDEWPIVSLDLRKHYALQRRVIKLALVKKRLDQTERGVIVQVINEFDISLKALWHLRVQRFQTVACAFLPQQRIELLDRTRKCNKVLPLRGRSFAEFTHFVHSIVTKVHKWTAQESWVLYGGLVSLWRLDVRVHDPQMAFSQIPRRGCWRNQMGPRVPPVHERLNHDIRL